MDMDQCMGCVTISNHELENASNVCYDGSHYYFLIQNKNRVVKTDLELHIVNNYETGRMYSYMCYDWKEHCFWAASKENCSIIYKCNCKMREIGSVRLYGYPESRNPVTGISYNCCTDSIILSYHNTIVKVNKNTGRFEICFRFRNGVITAMASLCPGYLIAVRNGDNQIVYAIKQDMTMTEIYSECTSDTIQSLVFRPMGINCQAILELFFVKECENPCIKEIAITNCELGFEICECNYEICQNSCGITYDPAAYCYDVIESIALIEAAISHILNAEGEKIQKIVKITEDIDSILCVNQSVNDIIINITGLEHELYSKLMIAYKLCTCAEQSTCSCHDPKEYFKKELDVVKYLHENIVMDQ